MKPGCPTEEQLADYLEDRITEARKLDVERHIARCKSCFEEFVSSRALVRGGESHTDHAPESLTLGTLARLGQKGLLRPHPRKTPASSPFLDICRQVGEYFGFSPRNPALAPIRGSKRIVRDGFVEIRKAFQDLSTVIEIEKMPYHKVNIRVSFPACDHAGESIRTTLVKDGRDLTSLLSPSAEPAVFHEVPFGAYALSFHRGGTPAGEYHFEIKD